MTGAWWWVWWATCASTAWRIIRIREEAPRADIYFPYAQGTLDPGWPAAMILLVRSNGQSLPLAESLRAAVSSVDSEVPVGEIRTMSRVLSGSIAEPRSTAWLFLSFALLALALGIVGVYSVISYSVAERFHEIGVRFALGALRRDVLTMVLKEGLLLTLLGVVIGLASALAADRVMSSLLYGVQSRDPLTLLAASVLLPGVALVACYIPARRASRVDPMGVRQICGLGFDYFFFGLHNLNA
jgi:putative ABC transport system permease protein